MTNERDTRLDEADIYRLVLEHALDLVSVLDREGRVLYASPSHERILGYPADALVGRRALDLVHPADRDVAESALATTGVGTAVRVRHRDGHWVHVEGRATPAAGLAGNEEYVVAVSRDVTARVRHDRLRDAQYAVTEALAEADSLNSGAEAVLRAVAERLDWEMGLLWHVDEPTSTLRCVAVWRSERLADSEFEALSRTLVFAPGEGLPGRVWASRTPTWIPDVAADRGLPRRDPAERSGIHGGVAVPVLGGGVVWGVMEFFSGEVREAERDVLGVLATFGGQLGQFVERKLAEEALRRAEERKRAIVESALDGIVTMDDRGCIVEFNAAAERTFGYAAEEVVGRQLADVLVPPELRQRHRVGLARYLRTGDGTILGQRLEMPGLHASGRRIPVELAIVRVDLPGRPLFTGYIRDISQRRKAEEELRKSRALLQAVADGTPDAVFVKDREGRYLLINESGARALGRSVDAVVGARDADLMPAELARDLIASDRVVLETGETHVSEERVGDRVYLATKAPYRDEHDEVVGVLGIAHDVTERRRLEGELLQAQKMEAIGRLAGGVAHDFNNILSVIRGFSDLALRAVGDSSGDVQQWLRHVCEASERGTALTQQLLTLSRGQSLEREVLDLNAVVAEMDALLRRVLGEDLRLVTVFAASDARVQANRGQLEQVILNLAVNARDAMPQGGKLTIETSDAVIDGVPHVALRVSDTGTGMDDETRARIFEPFFTTKSAAHGTGLGLSIVYGIVSQNGGQIEALSSPGAGATFVVHLPLARVDSEPTGSAPADLASRPITGTLVVAEDDDALRQLLRTMLEQAGYRVLAARNGDEALDLAASFEGQLDGLVTDVVMPGIRGPELAARLRASSPQLPVVFITGYTEESLEPQLRAGDPVLAKPFGVEELLETLAALLGPERRTASG